MTNYIVVDRRIVKLKSCPFCTSHKTCGTIKESEISMYYNNASKCVLNDQIGIFNKDAYVTDIPLSEHKGLWESK